MCIMGNGNDLPTRMPSWKFLDEKHESNKLNSGLIIIHMHANGILYSMVKASSNCKVMVDLAV